jgi:hypothetical protein
VYPSGARVGMVTGYTAAAAGVQQGAAGGHHPVNDNQGARDGVSTCRGQTSWAG